MKTITIELYDVHELEKLSEGAFRKAHEQFTEAMWDMWFTESITDVMSMVADGAGCPFGDRFLEWDLYRGLIGYADGALTHREWEALIAWDPELAGHEELALIVRHGLVQQSEDHWIDDKAEPLIDQINERLRDLYAEMMGAARQEEMWLESPEYFREDAESNGWTFEANGKMRNV